MRCLKRNQVPFWYCLYRNDRVHGDTAIVNEAVSGISVINDGERNINYIVDEYGNETGERILNYAPPVRMMANISPATGQAQTEQFGNLESYDKVIVTDDVNCPIDEHTVLFLEVEPVYSSVTTHEQEGTKWVEKTYLVPKYDYIVKRVAKSLNSVSIAVRKVETG